jgi:Zn-dependent M32 family carboxypeptidase
MQIFSDLTEIKAFKYTTGREGHKSFPTIPKSLINIDYRDLHKWMKDKILLWGSIYERKTEIYKNVPSTH